MIDSAKIYMMRLSAKFLDKNPAKYARIGIKSNFSK